MIKIGKFTIRYQWILVVILMVLLGVESGVMKLNNKRYAQKINDLTLSNQTLDSISNKRGQVIYTQAALITNIQSEVRQLAQDKFDLQNKYEKKVKDIEFFYQAKLKAQLPNTIYIPYKDTTNAADRISNCDTLKAFVDAYTITVPKQITLDSTKFPGVDFDATILKSGLKVNQLSISDSQFIRVDKIKRNFLQTITFKKNKYEVKVLHTSPFFKVEGQNSIIYQPPKKANLVLKAIVVGGLLFLGHLL